MDDDLWEFVVAAGEHWGSTYGLPPAAGRVFGWLLVCDPPEQTADDLAAQLKASKGSISTATKLLTAFGMIDRLRIRGERADRFRLKPGVWDQQLTDPSIDRTKALIRQGLEALADAPAPRSARLRELDLFYAWYGDRCHALVEEWREYRRTHQDETRQLTREMKIEKGGNGD